jgi:hypothetical protein
MSQFHMISYLALAPRWGHFPFRANVVATQDAGEKTVSVMAVTKLS